MFRSTTKQKKLATLIQAVALTVSSLMLASVTWAGGNNADAEYSRWQDVGARAAFKAAAMIRKQSPGFKTADSIALTNAGYADINGRSTMAALDGLSSVLKISRGAHSLIEIHSSASTPLWFAVYDKDSGNCAYLQVDPAAMQEDDAPLFSKEAVEQVNAEHLFANPAEYGQKFDDKVFGGNEFRIVTIANAVAAGVSTKALRAFEFHDHYCPGVTSGILLAKYIEQHFSGSLFIQSIQPWCKEDALQAILNTTPGKKGYDVLYPTEADLAAWPDWAKAASPPLSMQKRLAQMSGPAQPWDSSSARPAARRTATACWTSSALISGIWTRWTDRKTSSRLSAVSSWPQTATRKSWPGPALIRSL